VHYRDDDPPASPAADDEDDLVGPRRGASAPRSSVLDDEDGGGTPRIPAPRLRRGTRESVPGLNRETLVRLVRDIPAFIKLLARLMRDPRVSRLDRVIVGAVLAYFVSPVDLVPDLVFPVLGQVDDIYFLALALSRLVNNAGTEVLLEHWDGEESSLELLLSGLDRASAILPAPARGLLGKR
jgi:uncharacterized membrane protein YkvA (DUF1232 family)